MTEEQIMNCIALQIKGALIFDHYDPNKSNIIHIKDKYGNTFTVTVRKEK